MYFYHIYFQDLVLSHLAGNKWPWGMNKVYLNKHLQHTERNVVWTFAAVLVVMEEKARPQILLSAEAAAAARAVPVKTSWALGIWKKG